MSGARLTRVAVLLVALVLSLATGSAAQDVLKDIVQLAARARELQTPERARTVWGPPRQAFGDYKPLFVYDSPRPVLQSVELKYASKDAAPRRLEFIDFIFWNQKIGEAAIRDWLGSPASIEKDPDKLGQSGARWLYNGKDRADLRVIHVLFNTAAMERARVLSRDSSSQAIVPTITVRISGAPR